MTLPGSNVIPLTTYFANFLPVYPISRILNEGRGCMKAEKERRFITPWEMAQELGVSRAHIYEMVRQKRIPAIKLGKVIRIDREGTIKLFEKGLQI